MLFLWDLKFKTSILLGSLRHQILKKQLYLILSRRAGMVVREKRAGMVTAQQKQNLLILH